MDNLMYLILGFLLIVLLGEGYGEVGKLDLALKIANELNQEVKEIELGTTLDEIENLDFYKSQQIIGAEEVSGNQRNKINIIFQNTAKEKILWRNKEVTITEKIGLVFVNDKLVEIQR
ncbi:hypothetical protein [Psychrobacillus sp. FSL K6-1464]|uniref:hypothetical protein n=1 Tax=Psychrobacillus sp. FSL K6-1464 TaxID=2921545 RepID=UPI0030FB769D